MWSRCPRSELQGSILMTGNGNTGTDLLHSAGEGRCSGQQLPLYAVDLSTGIVCHCKRHKYPIESLEDDRCSSTLMGSIDLEVVTMKIVLSLLLFWWKSFHNVHVTHLLDPFGLLSRRAKTPPSSSRPIWNL